MSCLRSMLAVLCLPAIAWADDRVESQPRPCLVVLIGGFDSEPTAEQLAGTAPRGVGNSGMFQLAADLRREGLQAEYFNWNGTAAGKGKGNEKPFPGSAGIAKRLRKHHHEHPAHKLAVVGNSWGGHTAWEVSQLLAGLPVAKPGQPKEPTAEGAPAAAASLPIEPVLMLDLVVFLDPSSLGRFDKSQPAKLSESVRHAVTYATRNSVVWRKWPDETRNTFIDLGDPKAGYLRQPGPAYDSFFDFKAHIAAEWDDAIHRDIRERLLMVASQPEKPGTAKRPGGGPSEAK